jgi:hypothetical protein
MKWAFSRLQSVAIAPRSSSEFHSTCQKMLVLLEVCGIRAFKSRLGVSNDSFKGYGTLRSEDAKTRMKQAFWA